MEKLWDGRFSERSAKIAEEYNTSLPVDKKMYSQDIKASIAHAKMLAECGIISAWESEAIIKGLSEIKSDIENGRLIIENAEDIHMFVEAELIKRIGDTGKKLHTARSRNDQVVTDFKLYVFESINEIKCRLKTLIFSLINISCKNLGTVMPGFTHLQKAQPVTLAFHLSAYGQMLYRDLQRFDDCQKRVNYSPLGSGALAGTTYPIDRHSTAAALGFTAPTENAMDSVSDRDYAAEYMFCASLSMMHLSRLAEEVITWASDEYRFVELSDAYSTGSSIMPQKKNPDMAELVRGKTGRVYGNLVSMLTILKGLPLAYNKDLQEDKDLVFQTEDILLKSLEIFSEMLLTAKFNKAAMLKSACKGYTNATDFADYLVKKGLPFRDAHHVTGKLVAYCINEKLPIEKLPLSKLKEFSNLVETDIYDAISVKTLVNTRKVFGGTAPESVKLQLKRLKSNTEKIK